MISNTQFQRSVDTFLGKSIRSYFTDSKYSVITHDSLFQDLIPYYVKVRNTLLPFWETEKRDCDDFAMLFVMVARLLNTKKSGIAAGIFSFNRTPTEPHAVVLLITDKGPIVIEPQGFPCEVTLSEQQKSSARFLYA